MKFGTVTSMEHCWKYLMDVSDYRMKHNQTKYHIINNGELEQCGTVMEAIYLKYIGKPYDNLHLGFDGGYDDIFRGWKFDIKGTPHCNWIRKKHIQYPWYKTIRCDFVLIGAVDLEKKWGYLIGYTSGIYVAKQPINQDRDTPCREVAIPLLAHFDKIWSIKEKDESKANKS